jgi:hypothetical protein
MKQPSLIILSLFILLGCKKTVEKQEENAIVQAMTDGQWAVTGFTSNGTDIATKFGGYKFQYFSNNTVDAIKNGSIEKTGTWQGDINTMTISASFPNAVSPLVLLNGSWLITNNSWTYVEATLTVNGEVRTLRLDKQ